MEKSSRNTKEKCPCNGCSERVPATKDSNSCHVTCELYTKWQQERIQQNADDRLKKHENAVADIIRCTQLRKIRRRLRKAERR